MTSQTTINDVKTVLKKLDQFESKLTIKITRAALRNGANLTLKSIRREAPKQSGRLRRAVHVASNRKYNPRTNGKVGVSIKIRKGKSRNDPRGAYYGHMIIGGHIASGRRRGGTGKKTKPNAFVERGYNKTKQQAARLVIRNIEIAGQKIIRKF